MRIIRENIRPYIVLNIVVYGLLVTSLAVGTLVPSLNAGLTAGMDEDGTAEQVGSLLSTPWLFALTILRVNITTVALAMIVVPSLVVPFAGIAVLAWFTVSTGIVLAPVDHASAMTLIPHSLTMVIEFQAYILLLLGTYVLSRNWLRPSAVGEPTRWRGYLRGLRTVGRLAVPALVLFVLGAVYEAFSLRYIVPALLAG